MPTNWPTCPFPEGELKLAPGWAAKRVWSNHSSAGYFIDFGDGHSDGGNGTGGSTCLPSGQVAKFKTRTANQKHRYAKPGKYKVTVTGYYCGTKGKSTVKKVYWVKAR
ncbi:hypothetical protein AAEX63_07080 [Luteococcus sp. H138]|uniref:hypothetical protein n=1 Tax=unclassified Luteococcus TaxID=2639923 RepID=UPI00313D977E